jgi:hypothetical protein
MLLRLSRSHQYVAMLLQQSTQQVKTKTIHIYKSVLGFNIKRHHLPTEEHRLTCRDNSPACIYFNMQRERLHSDSASRTLVFCVPVAGTELSALKLKPWTAPDMPCNKIAALHACTVRSYHVVTGNCFIQQRHQLMLTTDGLLFCYISAVAEWKAFVTSMPALSMA